MLETSTVPTDFTLLAEAVPGVTADRDLGIITKAYTLMLYLLRVWQHLYWSVLSAVTFWANFKRGAH